MELSVDNLISVPRAMSIIDSIEVSNRFDFVPLQDSTGRRLANDITSDRESPAFDKALMDGFAVRCDEVANAPVDLSILGVVAAGASLELQRSADSAVAIMTGAPMPAGFDGLVPIEDTTRISSDCVRIHRATTPGRFIARQGSDCSAGSVVLSRGTLIGPAQVAVAASVGATTVSVFAPPRVAVLTTGDEIVPIDATPSHTQLRNSNSAMLATLLRKMNANVDELGIVRDDPQLIRSAIESALADHDILFITGGMSMGEFDFVPRVMKEMGAEFHITKLRIKPGKPFVFASVAWPPECRDKSQISQCPTPNSQSPNPNTKFIFGLPGNPVSGFVCTMRLASRLIARFSGGTADAFEKWTFARLTTSLEANGPREFYQPAIVRSDGTVEPLSWKGSADIFTLARANALLVRDENEAARSAGELVRVLQLLT